MDSNPEIQLVHRGAFDPTEPNYIRIQEGKNCDTAAEKVLCFGDSKRQKSTFYGTSIVTCLHFLGVLALGVR